ncbi:MAG TPA: sarcosine oxidase subunit gamma [Paracoccaceae bacterium]|nr:sarcosine oxidase subunit gamma [Paracoccaceae bacterium]HMO70721.1 sarcosine oxidase subunit gamma [Paracoccaceae bacterium]
MADLIPTPPLTHAPLAVAGVVLSVVDPGPLAQIALFHGLDVRGDPFLAPLGLSFPDVGQVSQAGDRRLVWTGRDEAMLAGAPSPAGLERIAAVTDQSDGWVCLSLAGDGSVAVLARLVPLDLRDAAFPPGRAARSALNHLPLILWREPDGFRLMTFRSMARTAWHEITEAMKHLNARGTAGC